MEEPHTSERMKSYSMEQETMDQSYHLFNNLRLAGALCDVVLVADGVKFKAHKIILSGYSSYFQALFTSGWNIEGKCEYTIPGISPEAMRLIIEYVYTHSVLVTVDNVEDLLSAADQLNILGIVECCSNFLEAQLCLENCTGIYITANIYHLPELCQSALHFILQNFKEVASTSEEFVYLTLHQLCNIIEMDELNVSEEDVVFDAILRWIMHEPAKRDSHISVLLPKVRMARMSKEYFVKNVMNHRLVKASEECRPIISETLKAMYDLDINGPPSSDFQNPLIRPRLPSEILLAIGGSVDHPSHAIEAYDARADRWVDVTQQDERPWAYHGAVYLQGFVYCVGGCDYFTSPNSVRKFDPIARTWHPVAPMHSRRCFVNIAVLNGFIYAIGGCENNTESNTVERYDPETDSWSFIQPMNERRSNASAATLHGKIYICGGLNGTEYLSSAECYDPVTDRWTMIPPMSTPRCSFGVVAYHGKIYAVGGYSRSESLQSVEAYDPLTNRWHAVAPMFMPRNHFGIGVVDDLLFVVGGRNEFGFTTRVECYDAGTGSWHGAQDIGISQGAFSCCVVPALPSIIEYAAPREAWMATQEEIHPFDPFDPYPQSHRSTHILQSDPFFILPASL